MSRRAMSMRFSPRISTPSKRGIYLFLTLTLFVARVGANHANDTSAAHNFAVLAKPFDRSADFHNSMILIPHDAAVRQIIGRHFHGHFVTSRETDAFGGGLAANMRQEAIPVGQFHPEQGLLQHSHY